MTWLATQKALGKMSHGDLDQMVRHSVYRHEPTFTDPTVILPKTQATFIAKKHTGNIVGTS